MASLADRGREMKLLVACAVFLIGFVPTCTQALTVSSKFDTLSLRGCNEYCYKTFRLELPDEYADRQIIGAKFRISGIGITRTVLTAGPMEKSKTRFVVGSNIDIYARSLSDNSAGVYLPGFLPAASSVPAKKTRIFVTPHRFDFSFSDTNLESYDDPLLSVTFGIFAVDYEPQNGSSDALDQASVTDRVRGRITAFVDFVPTPEPAALALFGLGVGALALFRARARRA